MPDSSSGIAPTLDSTDTSHFPLRAYFGHHKCATGWTGNILHEICMHLNLHIRIVNQDKDFSGYDGLAEFVTAEGVDVLVHANANAKHARDLPLYRGFHVVRDPRDILVSAYFSHLNSHPTDEWPELKDHRARLQSVSKDEGLMLELDFSRPFFEDMDGWDYQQDNVLEIHMEDLTQRPLPSFVEIMSYLEMIDSDPAPGLRDQFRQWARRSNRLSFKGSRFMPGGVPLVPAPRHRMCTMPVDGVKAIVASRTFERLTGRKKGQENAHSHLRKGVPGDWRNHFSPEHVRAFKATYNSLVLNLGYESDPDWS